MRITARVEEARFRVPLAIAGRTLVAQSVLCVEVRHGQHVACAEAAGVFYRGETGEGLKAEVDSLRDGLSDNLLEAWRQVQQMRPGGARNALDWALWQLVAAQRGEPAYRLAHQHSLSPRQTMVTIGVGDAQAMAQAAVCYPAAKSLKLKLDGMPEDAERVEAVRRERPDVTLCVDANEGWTPPHLDRMLGVLLKHQVSLIEQPLPASLDEALRGFRSPIPLAADESLQTMDDLERVARLYQVANIKLDKCGGLSAALALAREARRQGMRVMVGCMGGRSRAIMPAFIAAQDADLVDLDAPLLMAADTVPSAIYANGCVDMPLSAYDLPAALPEAGASVSPPPVRHAAS